MPHYDLASLSRRCCATGEELKAGQTYYTVLVESATGLERRDYSATHWPGPPENAVAYWRGRIPEDSTAPQAKLLSTDDLLDTFDRLSTIGDCANDRLRYVLALYLLRRKALILRGLEQEGGREFLLVSRSHATTLTRVPDQQLSTREIGALEGEVRQLLYAAVEPTRRE
jgi:hypothetical protein